MCLKYKCKKDRQKNRLIRDANTKVGHLRVWGYKGTLGHTITWDQMAPDPADQCKKSPEYFKAFPFF